MAVAAIARTRKDFAFVITFSFATKWNCMTPGDQSSTLSATDPKAWASACSLNSRVRQTRINARRMPRPPTNHWLLTPTAACATQGSRVTRWLSRNRLPSSEKSQATAFASRMTNACAPGRGAANGAGFDVRIAAADDGALLSAPGRNGWVAKAFEIGKAPGRE